MRGLPGLQSHNAPPVALQRPWVPRPTLWEPLLNAAHKILHFLPGHTQIVRCRRALAGQKGASHHHDSPAGEQVRRAALQAQRAISPLFSVVMTVASKGRPQPCRVLAEARKMYGDSGRRSVATNCLTVEPTSTVVNLLGLLVARR